MDVLLEGSDVSETEPAGVISKLYKVSTGFLSTSCQSRCQCL